jgi:cytochrome c oxidase subunit II
VNVLDPAGPVAAAIAGTAWLLIVGGTVIFIGVMALLAAVLWRRRPIEATQDHPQRRPAGAPSDDRRLVRRWIVGGGLVFPGVVLAALLAHTAARTVALDGALAAAEPVISVTAHSWWWQVRYRAPDGTDVALANELHLPAGRPVTLGLSSADVIHSFWVPQLAGKIDMVPGRVHRLRLQADRPGVYRGLCAEFCGAQHARMALLVVAHEPADFERWLAAQSRAAAAPADARGVRGRAVFEAQRCGACHTVRGAAEGLASLEFGPDLTHVGSRRQLAAGTRPLDRDTLAAWIADPQQWKPGARMPSYGDRLDDESLQALAAYLVQLE